MTLYIYSASWHYTWKLCLLYCIRALIPARHVIELLLLDLFLENFIYVYNASLLYLPLCFPQNLPSYLSPNIIVILIFYVLRCYWQLMTVGDGRVTFLWKCGYCWVSPYPSGWHLIHAHISSTHWTQCVKKERERRKHGMCVCVSTSVWMHVWVQVYACTCRGPKFFSFFPFYILRLLILCFL